MHRMCRSSVEFISLSRGHVSEQLEEIAPLLGLCLGFVDRQVVIIVTLVRLVKACFSPDAPSIECEGVLVLPVELLVLAIRICITSPRTDGPGERRNAAPSPGFLSQN